MPKITNSILIAAILLISSCADPAKEGSKLADDYCRCISKHTELDAVADFVELERQCADSIAPALAELREDFSGNTEKLATLNSSLKVGMDSCYTPFSIAKQEAIDELQRDITDALNGRWWALRTDDEVYVISLSGGLLKLANFEGETPFSLIADTIRFASGRKTLDIIVDDFSDDLLRLKASNSWSIKEFQIASNADKIVGSFVGGSGRETQEWRLEPNGKGTASMLGVNMSISYSVQGNVFKGMISKAGIKQAVQDRLSFIDSDLNGGIPGFSRIRKKRPSIYEIADAIGLNSSNASSSAASSKTSSTSSSSDWSALLDDYEQLIDSYIRLMKKAQAGDFTAVAEYPTVMEKALSIQKKLEEGQANGDLSADDIQKLLKLQQKMMNAAMDQ